MAGITKAERQRRATERATVERWMARVQAAIDWWQPLPRPMRPHAGEAPDDPAEDAALRANHRQGRLTWKLGISLIVLQERGEPDRVSWYWGRFHGLGELTSRQLRDALPLLNALHHAPTSPKPVGDSIPKRGYHPPPPIGEVEAWSDPLRAAELLGAWKQGFAESLADRELWYRR